ncbi:MAG: hypothetical protein ACOYOU_02280, partial [Kiritimatiellia bacterium]
MQANEGRARPIKVKGVDGFLDIFPQFIPRVGLRKNALAQTLGHKAAVRFLRNFKDNFIHFRTPNTTKPTICRLGCHVAGFLARESQGLEFATTRLLNWRQLPAPSLPARGAAGPP